VSAPPRVSAIVVSYNTRDDLRRAIASVAAASPTTETIVVDNASSDGSAAMVRGEFPRVQLIASPENVGFSRANNAAIARAQAPLVLFLNSDAELKPGCLEALVGVLDARPEVGAVGPRTVDGTGTLQASFGPALTPWNEWGQRRLVRGLRRRAPWALARIDQLASREHEPGWVSGSCLLARRQALQAIGGFDEGFFLYEEDVDLCLRLRAAGWRILFTPAAEVIHREGRSVSQLPDRARAEYDRSHLRYYRKHNGRLATLGLRAYLALFRS